MPTNTIELELLGNAKPVRIEEHPLIVPQTVTLPAPSKGDHVAVLRTDPAVRYIHVLPREGSPGHFESGLATTATVDGESRSECWVSVSALAHSDQFMIDTRKDQDLEAVSIDVEYRGWKARLQKRVREFKQKRRAKTAIARGGERE